MIEPSSTENGLQRNGNGNGGMMRSMHEAPAHRSNLLRMALRWWWVTPCCVLAALAVAKFYIVKTKPIYQSNARIYLPQNRPRILEVDNPLAVQQSGTYLSNESELIQSSPVLALVVDELPARIRQMEQPINYVKGGLSVGVSKNDDIMTVTFESTDPVEAADIANAVVRGYVKYHANQFQQSVIEVQSDLEKEKNQRDAEVNAKQKALAEFKHANVKMVDDTQKSVAVNQAMTTLADKLTRAQIDQGQTQTDLQTALGMTSDPDRIQAFVNGLRATGKLPPNTEAQAAIAKKLQLEQDKTELAGKYGPRSAQMKEMDSEINAVHPDAVEAETNLRDFKRYLSACGAMLESKKSEVANLQQKYDQEQKEASALTVRLADFQREQADMEADEAQAERLEQQAESQVKHISVAQDFGQAKMEVLEPAKPSFDPVRPQKTMVLGIALGMGMMLGLSGIVVCDWMDTRVRSPEQVLADLTVPVLGTVPRIAGGKSVSIAGRQVMLDPMSEVSEGYRSIRTALYFGMPEGRARTILVTSPMAGEGKSTMVSNLAIAMAQAGRRTLILDADFRKPVQHVVFGLQADFGLSSVLSGLVTVDEAVQHTAVDRLDLLPCGPIPMNPSESLNSQGFQQLLGELSDDYDCVVLDSAPVVPVTDARILAAICDLTLLVLRAEVSTKKMSVFARNSLYSVGAEIAGIVLNDVSGWRSGNTSYQYGSRNPRNGVTAEVTNGAAASRMPETPRPMTLVAPAGVKISRRAK